MTRVLYICNECAGVSRKVASAWYEDALKITIAKYRQGISYKDQEPETRTAEMFAACADCGKVEDRKVTLLPFVEKEPLTQRLG